MIFKHLAKTVKSTSEVFPLVSLQYYERLTGSNYWTAPEITLLG